MALHSKFPNLRASPRPGPPPPPPPHRKKKNNPNPPTPKTTTPQNNPPLHTTTPGAPPTNTPKQDPDAEGADPVSSLKVESLPLRTQSLTDPAPPPAPASRFPARLQLLPRQPSVSSSSNQHAITSNSPLWPADQWTGTTIPPTDDSTARDPDITSDHTPPKPITRTQRPGTPNLISLYG